MQERLVENLSSNVIEVDINTLWRSLLQELIGGFILVIENSIVPERFEKLDLVIRPSAPQDLEAENLRDLANYESDGACGAADENSFTALRLANFLQGQQPRESWHSENAQKEVQRDAWDLWHLVQALERRDLEFLEKEHALEHLADLCAGVV